MSIGQAVVVAATFPSHMFSNGTSPNLFLTIYRVIIDYFPDLYALIIGAIATLITVALYWLFFVPLNRVRDLSDVGYGYLEDECRRRGKRLKDVVNEVRARRKCGSVPPIYPNGWFGLVESRDLSRGNVKPVSALGENFAVFRSNEGEAYVLDAYCPHLGANLSVGGRVIGSCIECPFHGWQFDGKNGQCVHVPYSDKAPSFAKVKKWMSIERNGWIFVWYHAENLTPEWYPNEITEITKGEWSYRGRSEHYVNSHIQDIPENGGDIAHLPQVHSPSMLAGVDLRFMRCPLWNFAQHVWHASWKEGEAPDQHTATLNLTHSMKLFNKIPLFTLDVRAIQIGPAIVHLELKQAFGRGVFIQTVTPIAPLQVRLVHHLYTSPSIPSPYCKVVLLGEAIMLERDIMVWNNKTYESKPILVKEDRLIARHRRWYSQFYSENSPRLSFSKDTYEW